MFLSAPRPLPARGPMPPALDLLRVNLRLPLSFPLRSPTTRAAASRFEGLRCYGARARATGSKVGVKVAADELRKRWLDSISCPLAVWDRGGAGDGALDAEEVGLEWVVGVDPDVSGALALLRSDGDGAVSAQVFDTPHLQVMVGKRTRKRPDAKAIVQLLCGLCAPLRTTAYIEQSTPFPQDGKLGWWNGGYTYGLWIGTLVASGFSVIPVPSRVWKDQFDLYGSSSNKDDSRRVASILFPSVTSQLKRKKDHGRAEALLIAAYGKKLRLPEHSNFQER